MTLLIYGGKKLRSPFATFTVPLRTLSKWSFKRNTYYMKYASVLDSSRVYNSFGLSNGTVRFLSKEASKSYYEILKISPKATQAQVKNAYYDLSKQYHPDQYKGKEDPSVKFREITEAYQILGNFKKRRMYDKGLLNMDVAATPQEAEAYANKFYETRRKRGSVPTASGSTPIFNFDEWSKLHYESNLKRHKYSKIKYEAILRREREIREENKSFTAMYVILLLFAMVFVQQAIYSTGDVDVNKIDKSKKS